MVIHMVVESPEKLISRVHPRSQGKPLHSCCYLIQCLCFNFTMTLADKEQPHNFKEIGTSLLCLILSSKYRAMNQLKYLHTETYTDARTKMFYSHM